ncbi:MAG: hypothetical protein WCR59_13680, partial [Planctomycetota bacterium]
MASLMSGSAPLALFAACLPGLEPLLAEELRLLGTTPRPLGGGVAFAGDRPLLLRAHLHLGTASHVLLRCTAFPCRALGELQRKTALLPWHEWLLPRTPYTVRATSRQSRCYHTGAIEERVRNGIAKALGVAVTDEPAEGVLAVQIAARFVQDQLTLSLDTSMTPLHRRGYRLDSRKAPLREDLAHALLLAAGYAPGMPLLDPFCGAGTIAIEGAAIAAGLPAGRLRPTPLTGTPWFDESAWQELLNALPAAPLGLLPDASIAASDRDAGAITATNANAERAGLAKAITASCDALTNQPWFNTAGAAPARGLVATNPPFGIRVSGGDLGNLYQTLGHRVRTLGPGWRLAILAHDPRLARRTGIPLRQLFATNHGGVHAAVVSSKQ